MKRPPEMNAESLAQHFIELASERYPSPEKVIQIANKLGAKSIEEKIILISKMRDAVREVAVNRIFRSYQHRDELFNVIINTLENLEDQLEDAITKEEEEQEIKIKEKS